MRDKKLDFQNYCPTVVNHYDAITYALFSGYSLEKSGTTICDLRERMSEYRQNADPMVQVDSQRKNYTHVFTSPEQAIKKFEELTR